MTQLLLILGASARAAAYSARRAGFVPLAADLFADSDLVACCHAVRVANYPHGLEEAAEAFPDGPWIYTGALENHPELVDRIAARRELYGMMGECLRRIRDPFQVAEVLDRHQLPCPRVSARCPNACDFNWLRKPRASSGGAGIVRVHAEHRSIEDDPAGIYYQEFIRGRRCSALFVAAGGRSVYLGATEQLIGCGWAGARGFQYVGSLGPLRLSEPLRFGFQRLGECLAANFTLRGLFGVDAVIRDDRIWPLEVNPRYTASVEILELAGNHSLLRAHVAACREDALEIPGHAHPTRRVGKAIVYATRDVTVPERLESIAVDRETANSPLWLADLPESGQRIISGRPVLTVLARGDSLSSVRDRLRREVGRVRTLLDDNH